MTDGQPAVEPMTATPEDFQYDGEVEVEAGSTLADDDEAKMAKAQNLFQLAVTHPDLVNPQAARDELLRAFGKSREMEKWVPPPPPPPMEEKPRLNMTVSWKGGELPPETQVALLKDAGVDLPPVSPDPSAPPPGMPPGPPPGPMAGPPPNGVPAPPMAPPPDDHLLGASAVDAARGSSPFRPKP